ncbi:methanogenesis marker 9 domain-containing protein [Methanogenium organophilum]|uniref:Methanogenesis marker 9 domain-containing protein n=1 Tax=Methanogenium organophilum TaxID=2199 RepID=A0A9X9T7A7_METOG|nr:methanogenesis marker 9 domain-containing protein [Methanogenium organophilum]WAI01163.1 methanogenesis marker 9 domain-containing protein [Methanogenium organophilum]
MPKKNEYNRMIMDPYDRYELMVNGTVVQTPIALASMAGVVDAEYALARSENAGMVCIGGYSIDEATMAASRLLVESGREEFLTDNPIAEIRAQAQILVESGLVVAVNMRGSAPESFAAVARAVGPGLVYEIDAHCRQEPIIATGCGEALLHDTGKLEETVRALKAENVTVSVKIRAGVADDDRALARALWQAGADILHIDLMDFGHTKLRQIRNACPLILIANNSISSFSVAKDMLAHGADLISLARHADPETLASLNEKIAAYADETGWYNAPKQLCRGGDIRSLTFCCMPVKKCPLLPVLETLGISRNEFMSLKLNGVKNTPIEGGENTCFGSLAWCCKSSTPCIFRNMALQEAGLSLPDYMRYKRRLSEKLMKRVFEGDAFYATE